MSEDKWIYIPQHLPQDGKPVYALITGTNGEGRYFRVCLCCKQPGPFERFNVLNQEQGPYYLCKISEAGYFNTERVIAWMPFDGEVPEAAEPPKEIVDAFLKHQEAIDNVLAAFWRPARAEKPPVDTFVIVGIRIMATALQGMYCSDGKWATVYCRSISDKDKPRKVGLAVQDPFYELRDPSQIVCWTGCETDDEIDAHLLARGLKKFCKNLKEAKQ